MGIFHYHSQVRKLVFAQVSNLRRKYNLRSREAAFLKGFRKCASLNGAQVHLSNLRKINFNGINKLRRCASCASSCI